MNFEIESSILRVSMWREVKRTYHQEVVTTADGKKNTQIKPMDVVIRELQEGDVVLFGGPEMGSGFNATILDNDRASIRATNNILMRLRVAVLDQETQKMEGRLGYYYAGVIEQKSVVTQLDQSLEHTVVEWYPEPEKPSVAKVADPSIAQAPVESNSPDIAWGLRPKQLELLRARARVRATREQAEAAHQAPDSQEAQAETTQPKISVTPQLKRGSLLLEAYQAIAERQKYPTLPPHLHVTPSIPEGLDPRPREYYVGNRGSGYPVLPPAYQTNRMPWDHRPPGYHEGGSGPGFLPPWARPPKGPIGR